MFSYRLANPIWQLNSTTSLTHQKCLHCRIMDKHPIQGQYSVVAMETKVIIMRATWPDHRVRLLRKNESHFKTNNKFNRSKLYSYQHSKASLRLTPTRKEEKRTAQEQLEASMLQEFK